VDGVDVGQDKTYEDFCEHDDIVTSPITWNVENSLNKWATVSLIF